MELDGDGETGACRDRAWQSMHPGQKEHAGSTGHPFACAFARAYTCLSALQWVQCGRTWSRDPCVARLRAHARAYVRAYACVRTYTCVRACACVRTRACVRA
eukprot:6198951-Pleurochrysis_carterae.AAC.2